MTDLVLAAALGQYERELLASDKADATIDAYVYRARRFTQWLASVQVTRATRSEIQDALKGYEASLHSAYPAEKSRKTFLDGARRFVRWLNGTYHATAAASSEPRPIRRAGGLTGGPSVGLEDLLRARARYREIEPRDLFYRAAIDLVGRAWKQVDAPLTPGEALAVLLFTWNRAYYRYNPASSDHVDRVEDLVARHRTALAGWRAVRLEPATIGDREQIEVTFRDFEELLGPVGAAKGLHLLAPTFFPIWDRTIASAYRCGLGKRGTNARNYIRFIELTARQCAELAGGHEAPTDVVKALDEWNYVTFTRQGG